MAPSAEPPSTITIRVKVPPGSIPGGADEFTLGTDIAVSSRIGQIRERIQQSIPSTPAPERQRLLYGGRALVDNEQTVGDAFNIRRDPLQQEYVVHLLIKGEGASAAPTPRGRGAGTPNRSASPAHQQGDSSTQQQQQVPLHQNHMHQHFLPHQHVQHHQAAVAQHQQRLQMQMPMNATQNRFNPPPGLMPFGMQPMHFGQPAPAPFPQPGMPAGFPQMTGHNHHQPVSPQQSAPQTGSADVQGQQQTGTAADEQSAARNQEGLQTQHGLQHPRQQPPNNQGFHMEGIGPNGERITVHQQTVNFTPWALPGPPSMHMPHGQTFMGFHGIPPLPAPPARPQGPSALETARTDIADARRRLEALRTANARPETDAAADSLETEIDQIEQRMQALSDYIDPLHLGVVNDNRPRTASPRPALHPDDARSAFQPSPLAPSDSSFSWERRAQAMRQQQQNNRASLSDVACYLLSSPTGPEAILYSPQHGAYYGAYPRRASPTPTGIRPTSTTTANTTGNAVQPNPAPEGQGQVAAAAAPAAQAQAQAQAGRQDPMGPLAPVVNHLWLLLRILIFSYFLLGANLGWRRPLALIAIGLGFWMIRMGLLAEGAAVRRWWDGIMNENQQRPRAQQGQGQQQGDNQDQQNQREGQPIPGRGQMPTPEQLAQRLLNEDARVRNERLQWIRERLRPIERAVMLLFASLWPGVGEAYVREREQEERHRAEEEIAARRREEEERQRKEQEDQNQAGDSSSSKGTKDDVPGSTDPEIEPSIGASEKASAAPAESGT